MPMARCQSVGVGVGVGVLMVLLIGENKVKRYGLARNRADDLATMLRGGVRVSCVGVVGPVDVCVTMLGTHVGVVSPMLGGVFRDISGSVVVHMLPNGLC